MVDTAYKIMLIVCLLPLSVAIMLLTVSMYRATRDNKW